MNDLTDLLKTLRFKYVEQARIQGLTYDGFLRRVLSLEIEGRNLTASRNRSRRRMARLRLAKIVCWRAASWRRASR